jgi:DNA-binding HxlR family transcriptional regulator
MTVPRSKYLPVETFLSAIKGKYKIPILIYLKVAPRRYYELKRKFSNASERVLINQLKEMIRTGIIDQKKIGSKAPFISEYSLSAYGRTLCSIIAEMWEWGEDHLQKKS